MKNKTFKFNPVLVTIQKVCVKVTDLCMKIAQGLFSKKKKYYFESEKKTQGRFLQCFFCKDFLILHVEHLNKHILPCVN